VVLGAQVSTERVVMIKALHLLSISVVLLPQAVLNGAVTGICCHKLKPLKKLLKQVRVPVTLLPSPPSVSGNSKSLTGPKAIKTQPVVLLPVVGLQGAWLAVQGRSPVRTT
jgi:hypothetical protein